jgi:tetratricopeptide (TPR) repeat protein
MNLKASPVRALIFAACLAALTGCSGTPESREARHMAKGKGYLETKEYKKAIIEFKVASQNMRNDAEPLYQLGLTYLSVGAAKQAYETFVKAVTVNPKHEGALYQVALFKVGSNKPAAVQEAKQVIALHIQGHPEDAEALGSLALAEAKLGNKEEALKLLQSAVEKNPANMRPAAVIIALYAAKGDTETAKVIAKSISDRFPDLPAAAVLRAQVSLATKDTEDADSQISKALTLKRDFRPALELRLRRELMNKDSTGAEQTVQELSRLPEKNTWAAYGRILFAEKKIEPAIAEYQRVLKEHGDDVEVRNEYSTQLMAAGRPKDAQAIVSGTLAKSPKDKPALLQRATLEIDRGEFDAASKDVRTLQELKVVSAQLSFQQARIFGARGDTIKQGDLLAEALKYNPRFFSARLELSRLLIGSGKSKNALDILNQAAPIEKRTAEYFFYRNMALIAAGNFDEARKSVDSALASVRSPGFLYQDALLRVRNHDLTGARKSLDDSLKIAPSDVTSLKLLGDVMRKQGEIQKYVPILKDAAAKNPGSAGLQGELGNQLASVGDLSGARAAFEAARSAGDIVNANCEIATLDLRSGALDPARQRLLELIKTHDNARARLMLAEIETRKGAPADVAVQHYLKAIQLEPANPMAMNNLADTLATQGKFDDALFWAQKALALTPASAIVDDTIGWIYYRQGKYDAGLPYLEKSARAFDRPLAHYHLAAVLFKAGDATRGRKEYETGVKNDPQSATRVVVRPLFEGKQ